MAAAPAHVRWTRPIWTALGRLRKLAGFDKDTGEDILRAIVLDVSGQTSTRKLSRHQAREVLDTLNERVDAAKAELEQKALAAKQPPPGEYRHSTRTGRDATEDGSWTVTKDQSKALLDLSRLLGWSRAQLRTWIGGRMRHVCKGAPWPQTREQAQKLHEGLEAMVLRRPENEAAQVLDRATKALRANDLTPWERKFLVSLVVDKGELAQWNRRKTMTYRSWRRLVKLSEIEHSREVRDA